MKRRSLHSYDILLEAIKERAALNDGEYVAIQERLQHATRDTLADQGAIWHRKCYQDTTSKSHIQRARERYDNSMSAARTAKPRGRRRKHSETEEPSQSEQPTRYTRSHTAPLEKDLCFFCQEDTGETTFRVSSSKAGKSLKDAVEKSGNPALMARLNTSIRCTCN